MALGRSLQDADGIVHPMLGLLDHSTSFAKRKMNLGYRQARLVCDSAVGRRGDRFRGHEFHYATLVDAGEDAPLAEISDGLDRPLGSTGGRRGLVTGSFFHLIALAGDP